MVPELVLTGSFLNERHDRPRARSTTTVALLVVGDLSALWFVIGASFGFARVAIVLGLAAVEAPSLPVLGRLDGRRR